jgi:hypothetical protein
LNLSYIYHTILEFCVPALTETGAGKFTCSPYPNPAVIYLPLPSVFPTEEWDRLIVAPSPSPTLILK